MNVHVYIVFYSSKYVFILYDRYDSLYIFMYKNVKNVSLLLPAFSYYLVPVLCTVLVIYN